jgi:hypothetical protein
MSRRKGQNPKVRVGKRADGTQYYFFQYWIDVPGQEERQRGTEVIGSVTQMTRSEAERKKLEFITKLELNSSSYQVPPSSIFADAVKHYRDNFGPAMHRENSTLDVWEGRIKNHLEADWKDVPVEHITIESVNEWALEETEGRRFVGNDQGCTANDAAHSLGVLQARQAAVFAARTSHTRTRQIRNEDS